MIVKIPFVNKCIIITKFHDDRKYLKKEFEKISNIPLFIDFLHKYFDDGF